MLVKKFITDEEILAEYRAKDHRSYGDEEFKVASYYFNIFYKYNGLYDLYDPYDLIDVMHDAFLEARDIFDIKHGDARDDKINRNDGFGLFQFHEGHDIPDGLSMGHKNWENWNEHKNKALQLANLIEEFPELKKYAIQLRETAQNIDFEYIDYLEYGKQLKFKSVLLSRWRHDPVSIWRRSLKWQAKWYQAIPSILDKYPSHRWLHITLSIYDCEITELNETIDLLNNGFKKLLKRNDLIKLKNLGWFKSIEVKQNIDETANPLLHVMLLVPSSYFSSCYIKKAKWIKLWQSCLEVEYGPDINIYEITNNKNIKLTTNYVIKTVKYITDTNEVANLLKDADWTREYISQVKNLRFIAVGGSLKDFFTKKENEDRLEHIKNSPLNQIDEKQGQLVHYSMLDQYSKVKTNEKNGVAVLISDCENITLADRLLILHLKSLRYLILEIRICEALKILDL